MFESSDVNTIEGSRRVGARFSLLGFNIPEFIEIRTKLVELLQNELGDINTL